MIFFLRWLFWEKPRGLDFSMRNKTRNILSPTSRGYALTPYRSFTEMMRHIMGESAFIDIGCGKGGVCYYAHKAGFGKVAGIELEHYLAEIARRNFARLKLSDKIQLFETDALTFPHYDEYNVFYTFNQFKDNKLFSRLYSMLIETCRKKYEQGYKLPMYIICFGGCYMKTLEDSPLVELVSSYKDPYRESDVNIWKFIYPGKKE